MAIRTDKIYLGTLEFARISQSNEIEMPNTPVGSGTPGPQGPQGIQGPKGDKGDTGDTGQQGIQGIQGPIGYTGPKGDKGDTGDQGIQGIQGVQGVPGNDGSIGPKGDTGPPGTTTWSGITDKPSTFPPESHSHSGTYEPANANIQTHVTSAHAPSNAQKNSDITKAEIEAKLIGEISTHTHAGGGSTIGYCIQGSCPNQATTTDGQTVYWGNLQLAQQTVADNCRIYIPKAGTIKVAYVYINAGTAGTAENWTMNIRKNNTTDYLIQTLALSNVKRVWSNAAMNVPVTVGDYIEVKEVQPTWATNPANIRRSFICYIE